MSGICFGLFLCGVIGCVATGTWLLWALLLGIAAFGLLGRRRGFTTAQMWQGAWREGRKMLLILPVFLLIGAITGLWRISGTIAYFIYYGVRIITPNLFILMAFVLTALMSYALGTSFGVVGTAGVILMALARSGGVSEAVAAGAILSGAYFGDRCSPASSSALLVAAVTETKLYDNLKMMQKTGALPLAVTLGIYALLSARHPLSVMDSQMTLTLEKGFVLSPWVLLPAALILLLPLCRVPIRWAMAATAAAAAILAVAVQHADLWDTVVCAVTGYHPDDATLAAIFSGGGVTSMLSSSAVVFTTGLYMGLLEETKVLSGVQRYIDAMATRCGLYPATAAVSLLASMVFCNQSIAAVMSQQLMAPLYREKGAAAGELAMDIENSGIVLAPAVPWNIAVSIPLAMLGADARAIPYAVLLFVLPLVYGVTKRLFYPKKEAEIV